jgi:nitrous oxide reductase accessory protein NosL
MATLVPQPLVALVAIIVVVGALASNASAQEVECEQVPYSERIIGVCTSTGSNDKEMPGPAGDLSEPAPPPTQAVSLVSSAVRLALSPMNRENKIAVTMRPARASTRS